jgi:flagellar biosynthetic protein FlhB
MAEDHAEKTQQPTPQRRQRMRDAGRFAHSLDLSSAGVLLGGLLGLVVAGGALAHFLVGLLGNYLSGAAWLGQISTDASTHEALLAQWNPLVLGLAKVLLPVLGLLVLLAVLLNLLQTGFVFLPSRVLPDFSRASPISGVSRIASRGAAVRFAFSLAKIAVIVGVAGFSLHARRGEIALATALDLSAIAVLAWDLCLWTSIKIGAALGVVAIADYGYQWWRREQDLKMTPQELREEMRNLQGDPSVVARRRQIRAKLGQHALVATVPKADVVIGRGEFAVALRYDARAMAAPVVVATGAGVMAERIRSLATDHEIPIADATPLAEALHHEVAIDAPIPPSHWAAVAQAMAAAQSATALAPQ